MKDKFIRISVYDPQAPKVNRHTSWWVREGDFSVIVTPPCRVKGGAYKYRADGGVLIELEDFQHGKDVA